MKEIALKASIGVMAFFLPIAELFFIVFCFVCADLVTGTMAAKNRHLPRTPRRFRKSVAKFKSYLIVIMLSFGADKILGAEWFMTHRAICAFLCGVEFVSMLENIAVITGNSVFVRLIKLIRGKVSPSGNVLNDILDEKQNYYGYGGQPTADIMHGDEGNKAPAKN